MRTSLNKIRGIEEFLTDSMSPENRLVFDANQLLDPQLSADIKAQRETYAIIKAYGRAQLKHELNLIHQRLLTDPSKRTFRDLIFSIFQRK